MPYWVSTPQQQQLAPIGVVHHSSEGGGVVVPLLFPPTPLRGGGGGASKTSSYMKGAEEEDAEVIIGGSPLVAVVGGSKRPRSGEDEEEPILASEEDMEGASPPAVYENNPFALFGIPAWSESQPSSVHDQRNQSSSLPPNGDSSGVSCDMLPSATTSTTTWLLPVSSSSFKPPSAAATMKIDADVPPAAAAAPMLPPPLQDPCKGGVVPLSYAPTDTTSSTTTSLEDMALGVGCSSSNRDTYRRQQQQLQAGIRLPAAGTAGTSSTSDASKGVAQVPTSSSLLGGGGGGDGKTEQAIVGGDVDQQLQRHLPHGVRKLTGGVLTNLPTIPPTLRPLDAPAVPEHLTSQGIGSAQVPGGYVQHAPVVCYRVLVPIDHLLSAFETEVGAGGGKSSTGNANSKSSDASVSAATRSTNHRRYDWDPSFGRVGGGADFVAEVARMLVHHVRVICGCGGVSGAPYDLPLVRSTANAMLPQCVFETLMRVLMPPSTKNVVLPTSTARRQEGTCSSTTSTGPPPPPSYPVNAHTLHTLFAFDGFTYQKSSSVAATASGGLGGSGGVFRGRRAGGKVGATAKGGVAATDSTAAVLSSSATAELAMMGADEEGSNSMPIMMMGSTAGDTTAAAASTSSHSPSDRSAAKLIVPSGKGAVLGAGGGLGGVMGGSAVLFDLLRVISAEQERRNNNVNTYSAEGVVAVPLAFSNKLAGKEEDEEDYAGLFDAEWDRCWTGNDSTTNVKGVSGGTTSTVGPTPTAATSVTAVSTLPSATTSSLTTTAHHGGGTSSSIKDVWAVCSGVHISVVVAPRRGCTCQRPGQSTSLCATYPHYSLRRDDGGDCNGSVVPSSSVVGGGCGGEWGCYQFEITAVAPVYVVPQQPSS